jgi:hypothetical protein
LGTGSIPGTKQLRRGVEHPPPTSAEVKERRGYTSTAPLELLGLFSGESCLYLYLYCYVSTVVKILALRLSSSIKILSNKEHLLNKQPPKLKSLLDRQRRIN